MLLIPASATIRRIRFVILISCLLSVFGCSQRQLYNAAQQNRQQSCEKLPPDEREACLAQYQQSYDDYSEQRQQVIDGVKAD